MTVASQLAEWLPLIIPSERVPPPRAQRMNRHQLQQAFETKLARQSARGSPVVPKVDPKYSTITLAQAVSVTLMHFMALAQTGSLIQALSGLSTGREVLGALDSPCRNAAQMKQGSGLDPVYQWASRILRVVVYGSEHQATKPVATSFVVQSILLQILRLPTMEFWERGCQEYILL
jgi:hypothetical protein